MAIRKILLWPNPKLKEVSQVVSEETLASDSFKELLKDLADTMRHYRGVGISAIQVGEAHRVFLMRSTRKPDSIQTFVNPVITNVDDDVVDVAEGCLSLPGVVEQVGRYPWVVVEAHDFESGERRQWDLVGLEAQCAQHEMEHLDGKLFSDNYGVVKRDIARRKIAKTLKFSPVYRVVV